MFTNDNIEWNKTRINQLIGLTETTDTYSCYGFIFKNKYFDLWAPVIYIYPEFVFKRHMVKNMKSPKDCNFDPSNLIEPLSTKEKEFYGKTTNFHIDYILQGSY